MIVQGNDVYLSWFMREYNQFEEYCVMNYLLELYDLGNFEDKILLRRGEL